MNEETHVHTIKTFSWYFLELPKFKKKEYELTNTLDKWVYFIKHAENLNVIPTHVQEQELQTAYQLANQMSWNREELDWYEKRGIKIQDEIGALEFAEEKGIEKGKLEVAQKMLSLHIPVEQVVEATELPLDVIEQLSLNIQ